MSFAAGKSNQISNNNDFQPSPSYVKDIVIRNPANNRKKYNVMRFNASLNVDFTKWKNVTMERENNVKDCQSVDEDRPARRKKYCISSKNYKPEARPWILNVGGKSEKKFKGMREGGVGESSALYAFEQMPDGALEVYRVHECYNFKPIERYKTLSAEKAEREFARRKKNINHFSSVLNKCIKGGDDEEDEDSNECKGPKNNGRKLKITDMTECIDSDSDSDEEAKEEDSENDEKKKKSKRRVPEKKQTRDLDDEAFEESDDGDEEGRELDYISDSSDDEPDPETKFDNELKSVAEEDALRKLLTSDDEDDEEKNSVDEYKKKEGTQDKDEKHKDKKSDSRDSEEEEDNKRQKLKVSGSISKSTSFSISKINANKRKASTMSSDFRTSPNSDGPVSTLAKKPKLEPVALASGFRDYEITEDAVRRFLMVKPVTPTELLMKFQNKTADMPSDGFLQTITQILKKINPVQKTIQGKIYISIE